MPRAVLVVSLALLAGCSVEPVRDPPTGPGCTTQAPDAQGVHFEAEVPLRRIVEEMGAEGGEKVLAAQDVEGVECFWRYTGVDPYLARKDFERWLEDRHLSSTRVGRILVVSKTPLRPGDAPLDQQEKASFRAWSAPANGWFALLERASGKKVEHGDAPVDLSIDGVSADEILQATALVSRFAPRRKKLEDLSPLTTLPSGRDVPLVLEAVAFLKDGSLALVNGRVVKQGDEVVSGVRVGLIGDSFRGEVGGFLVLREGNEGIFLKKP